MPAPGMHSGLPTDDAMNLAMSPEAVGLFEAVKAFIADEIEPITEEFYRLGEGRADRWSWAPGQLELLETAKDKAKAEGLWNFFLPDAETGEGLSNLDYAYIAAELGKNPLASECLNCSAPDTGNMEVLERVGTPEQKKQWLKPLLDGEIRSAFAMTEPDVASSDAKNIACRAELDGDEWVINGEKYYISGAGDPRCKIMITMVQTSPDAPAAPAAVADPGAHGHARASRSSGPMHVFGDDDAPHGHMHLKLRQRAGAEGEHAAGRRPRLRDLARCASARAASTTACARSAQAERALDLMVSRGLTREAFGKPIVQLGKNLEIIAKARIEIEAMRLMVLKAAKAMDVLGNREARVWVSMVKAMVPERVCQIIDQAIQMHGATGVSQWTPLARMYAGQRTLRIADGPDEVHSRGRPGGADPLRGRPRAAGPAGPGRGHVLGALRGRGRRRRGPGRRPAQAARSSSVCSRAAHRAVRTRVASGPASWLATTTPSTMSASTAAHGRSRTRTETVNPPSPRRRNVRSAPIRRGGLRNPGTTRPR